MNYQPILSHTEQSLSYLFGLKELVENCHSDDSIPVNPGFFGVMLQKSIDDVNYILGWLEEADEKDVLAELGKLSALRRKPS